MECGMKAIGSAQPGEQEELWPPVINLWVEPGYSRSVFFSYHSSCLFNGEDHCQNVSIIQGQTLDSVRPPIRLCRCSPP